MTSTLSILNPSPGIYEGISYDDYAAIEAVRSCYLKVMHSKSPLHAKYEMENPEDDTPYTRKGSALHALLLEGTAGFNKQFVVSSGCCKVIDNKKRGLSYPCKNPGKYFVGGKWYCGQHVDEDRCQAVFAAARLKAEAEGWMLKAESELSQSLYFKRNGSELRISDHAANTRTRLWMLRNAVEDIRVDLPPYGNDDPRTILTKDEFETVQGMVEGIQRTKLARQLIYETPGQNEVTLIWRDAATGLLCKARLDMLRETVGIVPDLKSCACAAPEIFRKCLDDFGYARQAKFYWDGCTALGIGIDAFVFVPVENTPPYAATLYPLGRASLEAAAAQISKLMWTYKKCQDENNWPGYEEDVEIDLPGWVLRRAMEPNF